MVFCGWFVATDILAGLLVIAKRSSVSQLALAFLLAAPQISEACAVCSDGEKQNAMAFFWTTILLTAIPLALLGFLVRWAQVKAKAIESASEKEDMDVVPPAT